jgi:peptidoglycan hydrolase CwlO-like protein
MTNEQIITLVVSLIVSIPGILAFIVQYKKGRSEERKSDSEITKLITEAAGEVVKNLTAEIDRLKISINEKEIEFEKCKRELYKCMERIRQVEKSLEKLGNGE